MKAEAEVLEYQQAVAVRERSSVLLMPVMDIQTAMSRLAQFQEFISSYLMESQDGGNDGGDYGIIPGTKKKTLLKSGADKLCEVYGLYDEYVVISSVEDWDKGLFDYTLKCLLKSRRDDSMVGTGVGSCSSFESKYRWREQSKKCPGCGAEAIIKGKADYGGGWLCWNKKGGCGQKFKDGDKSIEGQATGRIDNPDIIDIKNTVLKMAKKRAKIDATIGATRSSGIFTQDMDELVKTPEVKAPEVATEAKTFSKPKPAPEAPKVQQRAQEPEPEQMPEEFRPAGLSPNLYITKDKQDWLRMKFRDSLPQKYQAPGISDQMRRGWLKSEGFIKEGTDIGSSTMITEGQFKAVAKAMLNWAKDQK